MSASFFSPVRFVGAVGSDCPFDLGKVFAGRDIDLTGLEIRAQSKTFRWTGLYHGDMDERTTEHMELNILAEAPPKVPDAFKDSTFVFLANTAPALQLELLEQVEKPVFVAADTMDCWIHDHLDDLKKLLKKIDCLIINEDEARLLASEHNLIRAGQDILEMGPELVIIKKGESGSITCSAAGDKLILPAYPASDVRDPTGAGDSFAGGFMGYLVECECTDFAAVKTAVAYGTVVASFTLEDFSVNGLISTNRTEIDKRLEMLRKVTEF